MALFSKYYDFILETKYLSQILWLYSLNNMNFSNVLLLKYYYFILKLITSLFLKCYDLIVKISQHYSWNIMNLFSKCYFFFKSLRLHSRNIPTLFLKHYDSFNSGPKHCHSSIITCGRGDILLIQKYKIPIYCIRYMDRSLFDIYLWN